MKRTDLNYSFYYNTLFLLVSSGRCDLTTLSILATESYFTSSARRCYEYFGWSLLRMLNNPNSDNISIGFAQIKVSLWRRFGMFTSRNSILTCLMRFSSIYNNYDLCQRLVYSFSVESLDDVSLLQLYCGRLRHYYFQVYLNNKSFIASILDDVNKNKHNPMCNYLAKDQIIDVKNG